MIIESDEDLKYELHKVTIKKEKLQIQYYLLLKAFTEERDYMYKSKIKECENDLKTWEELISELTTMENRISYLLNKRRQR